MTRLRAMTLGFCAVLVSPATAQDSFVGTASFWWEASLDGGSTWARDALTVADPSAGVLIRARAEWEPRPPEIHFHYFAGVRFDAVVVGLDGAGADDQLSQFIRAPLIGIGIHQAYAAMRFGNILKIDDIRDTLPPGEGTRGILVDQESEFNLSLSFVRDNPIELFRYRLALDGTHGERHVTQAFLYWNVPEPERRYIATYISSQGARNFPDAAAYDLRLHVVPAPGAALALLAFAALARRRRPS